MSAENLETIWVIVDETPQTPEEKGSKSADSPGNPWAKRAASAAGVPKAVKVSTQKLEAEMSRFLKIVSGLFSRAEKQVNSQSGLKLDEIEVSVEINGEGEVKLPREYLFRMLRPYIRSAWICNSRGAIAFYQCYRD